MGQTKNSIFLSTITHPSIHDGASLDNSKVSKMQPTKPSDIFGETMKRFTDLNNSRRC